MRHDREKVIRRTIEEFELLDQLVARLTEEQWAYPLARPETKDPWTVKDALAHITHWKADTARSARGLPRPVEDRGLNETEANHLIYMRWRDQPPQEILAWHRQVQEDVLVALRATPDEWFSGRERRQEWPYDLDGHSAFHRVKDIQRALNAQTPR
ncbi:MAG: hypothetical protein C3F13_14765 [Anaerolineales bacterium]|nr:ClbS/DfsB family four-helix bundle protein [Anaerolineae bacterium]PWB51120.1 MAG: hypothetical protein C3F13_14765 [Anaerolineales bacterium]